MTLEWADLITGGLADAGFRLTPVGPEERGEGLDHAEHFDPACEECAYLARPTRETLFPASDSGAEERLRAALEMVVVVAAETRPTDDATAVVLRVSEAARVLLGMGDDDYKHLTAGEVGRLVTARAARHDSTPSGTREEGM
jgi:hypothetical protein